MASKRKKKKTAPKPYTGEAKVLRARAIYGGKGEAEMIREADPDGIAVEHMIRRDASVADRLYRSGSLGSGETGRRKHEAAERFRADFERAQLAGFVAAADLMRSGGDSNREISDSVVAARQRIRFALGSLGFAPGAGNGSMTGKAAWWVLGVQLTLEEFALRMRTSGSLMDRNKASGLVIAAIERLAIHYGLVDVRSLDNAERSRAWAKGYGGAATRLRQRAERERISAAHADRQAEVSEDPAAAKRLRVSAHNSRIRARVLLEEAAAIEASAGRSTAAA